MVNHNVLCYKRYVFVTFCKNSKFLSKINLFVENQTFSKKSKFLSKIKIFVKNQNFCQKIKIFVKNQNFGQKSFFLSKIKIVVNNHFLSKIEWVTADLHFYFSIFWYPTETAQMATNDPCQLASFGESIFCQKSNFLSNIKIFVKKKQFFLSKISQQAG